MIILKAYNIILEQLTADKIELVRQWRTDPRISQYMEYKGEITPEMQKQWFKRITESHQNLYFMIQYEGKDIGVINVRNIDWDSRTGESGIFIWDEDLKGKGIALRAGYCLYDFMFEDLYFNQLSAMIYNTNPSSIKYHKKFGFMLNDSENFAIEESKNQKYNLGRIEYYKYKQLNISILQGG